MTDELVPFIVVPACDVPAGKMPAAATALIRRAMELGLAVRSTYAMALVPGVLKKVAGFVRGESGEGDAAKGGSMAPRTVTRETIAVRVRDVVTGWAAYLIWARDDDAGWTMTEAAVRVPGQWRRRVTWSGVYL